MENFSVKNNKSNYLPIPRKSNKCQNGNQKFIHIGDLVPTSSHLPLPYIMAYDTHPMTTLEMKKELYEKIVEEEMKVIFPHDIEHRIVEPSEISSFLG